MITLFETFFEYFQENPIAQIIGFCAVFLNVIAFITAKDKKFLVFMALSSFVWGLHFYLMGLAAAAYISFFDVIKNLIALKYKKTKKIIIFFIVSYVCIGFFTFQIDAWYSVIPIINSLLSVYFIFYLQGIQLKLGFLIILILWFIYNLLGHSLGGMTSDIILFISGLIGIYKIWKHEEFVKSKKAE